MMLIHSDTSITDKYEVLTSIHSDTLIYQDICYIKYDLNVYRYNITA